MKLIDKDALVAEIDKHLSYYKDLKDRGILSKEGEAAYRIVRILKSDINSLEVKEVDLEKEIEIEWNKSNPIDEGMGVESAYIHIEAFDMIAKHFFELGLKIQKG